MKTNDIKDVSWRELKAFATMYVEAPFLRRQHPAHAAAVSAEIVRRSRGAS